MTLTLQKTYHCCRRRRVRCCRSRCLSVLPARRSVQPSTRRSSINCGRPTVPSSRRSSTCICPFCSICPVPVCLNSLKTEPLAPVQPQSLQISGTRHQPSSASSLRRSTEKVLIAYCIYMLAVYAFLIASWWCYRISLR